MGRKRRALGEAGDENTVYEGQGDPLLVALFQEDAAGARALIESNLCNIEAIDQVGWRPLHRACFAGLSDIVSLLLERGADPTALDAEGCGPLHVAASTGDPDCCKLLVEARADPTQPDQYTGMTPQIYAVSKEEGLAQKLGQILGTVDQKALVAWSNPGEIARLNASAETEDERAALQEDYIAKLDDPKECCDEPNCLKPRRVVKKYNWGNTAIVSDLEDDDLKKEDDDEDDLKKEEEDGMESTTDPESSGFWESAMEHLPDLEDRLWVQSWDKPVLQFCSDCTLDVHDLNKGFTLTFHFLENPYFTNNKLEKSYYNFKSSPGTVNSDAVEIKSTEIDWKPGRDVTVEKVKGNEEEQPRFSFFRNFFCNLQQGGPFPDQFDEDNVRKMTGMDNREHMMEMLMGMEYDLGSSMRDQLVRFARQGATLTEAGQCVRARAAGYT